MRHRKLKMATERLKERDIHWVSPENFPVKKGERVYLECEFVKIGNVLSLRTCNTGQPITIREFEYSSIFVDDTAEESRTET